MASAECLERGGRIRFLNAEKILVKRCRLPPPMGRPCRLRRRPDRHLIPDRADDTCSLSLRCLREAFGDRAYLALTLRRRPNDQMRLHELSNMAAVARVPMVVTNDVLYHVPERRILQDVVTCIRHNVTIDDSGFRRGGMPIAI